MFPAKFELVKARFEFCGAYAQRIGAHGYEALRLPREYTLGLVRAILLDKPPAHKLRHGIFDRQEVFDAILARGLFQLLALAGEIAQYAIDHAGCAFKAQRARYLDRHVAHRALWDAFEVKHLVSRYAQYVLYCRFG